MAVSVLVINWRNPVRTKIVIHIKIIEKVNLFNYLGNMTYFEGELDIDNTLNNFFKITGILNNVFRPQKPLKGTRIKLYTIHWHFRSCYMAVKHGLLRQGTAGE